MGLEKDFWYDAHCHLADPELQTELPEIIARSQKAGIRGWVLGGIHPGDWMEQRRIQAAYGSGVIPCLGLHPWWVSRQSVANLSTAIEAFSEWLQKSLGSPGAHGIGEIGLDYSHTWNQPEFLELQNLTLNRVLELCRGAQKPLVLHVVQAHPEMLKRLDHWGPFPRGGMVHGFTGSVETAQEYTKRGFMISIGPGILKPGFARLKNAALTLPGDQILIETDSHEPVGLIQVAAALAAIRNDTPKNILEKTSLNLCRLFEI